MKKNYISPLMVEVNVEAEAMIAASLKLDNENKVDTSDGGQLSGDRRGEWGNLWTYVVFRRIFIFIASDWC